MPTPLLFRSDAREYFILYRRQLVVLKSHLIMESAIDNIIRLIFFGRLSSSTAG